jgi:hypothetical protein
MSIKNRIWDAVTGNYLKINGEGEASVVVHPHPPVDETVFAKPFRQFFTDDGSSTGSSDMLVDGSSTSVDFYIEAKPTVDVYIKTISVEIVDGSATLSEFGNLAALTNGIEFCHITNDFGTTVIDEAIKSNWDFIRLAAGNPSFGDGAGAFRANNVVSTFEGYIPVIDMATTFGLPWGLRLRKGTKDRLQFKLRDNVSTMEAFDIIGYGIEI